MAKYKEYNKGIRNKGIRCVGAEAELKGCIRVSLIGRVKFEQRVEDEEFSHVDIRGKNIPGKISNLEERPNALCVQRMRKEATLVTEGRNGTVGWGRGVQQV